MREFLDEKIQEMRKSRPTTSKPKGVGVIGLHEGRTLLLALNRINLAYPVAGCDLNPVKIEECKKQLPNLFYTPNYDEMLSIPEVEIVAIYTPDAMHGEHIVKAFEAGKDVICTKPLVNSIQDARMILEAGKKTGRKLLVGQSTRFFEPFQRQRKAFEKGEVGNLELVDAHYTHRMDWFYEKSQWAVSDTDWVFLGLSHPLDLLRWYLGKIDEVHAYGFTSELGKKYGLRNFDIYIVNVKSKEGKIGRAMGHYGLHEMFSVRNCIELFLYGNKSTSSAQYHDMKFRYTKEDGSEVCEDPLYELRHYYFNSEIHGMHYGEFANYTEYFVDALIHNKAYSPNLEEGVETFCLMEAVKKSAYSGKVVLVDEILEKVGLNS
ncbi:MAG: Gfo/Idh/MocA family oxidoreductase [Ignavibacteria bacterium]|nr:Gfo/Idh/MocA family oxidoreductase [Ignavibacteria bacterium]